MLMTCYGFLHSILKKKLDNAEGITAFIFRVQVKK
jgi:hypothetical protein